MQPPWFSRYVRTKGAWGRKHSLADLLRLPIIWTGTRIPKWAAIFVVPFVFWAIPLWTTFKILLGGYATTALRFLSKQALSQVAPTVLARRIREVIRIDVTQELVACRVPILYIQGTNDFVVPAGNLKRIRRLKPDIESIHLPAPHMILQTQPLLAARGIAEFVKNLRAG